jgi:hypothetical protein
MCGGSERADAEDVGEVGSGAASEERGWEMGERREGGEVWRRTTCQPCPLPRSDLREEASHPRGVGSWTFSNPSNLTFGGITTSDGISSGLRPLGYSAATAVSAYNRSCWSASNASSVSADSSRV